MSSDLPPPGARPCGSGEIQRLRALRLTLQQRQAEIAEMARRSNSSAARAAYARAGCALARAIADLGTAQVAAATPDRAAS